MGLVPHPFSYIVYLRAEIATAFPCDVSRLLSFTRPHAGEALEKPVFRKLFVDHPRTVNETYGEHWCVANRFGVLMILAGLGAIVHGFIPGLMVRTGSNMIRKLHGEMSSRQPRVPATATSRGEWQLEYEI
jgi:hypothetical protein